jgi:dipeptidyl aminopeptidase/acylaminoacyl peptidase
VGNARRGVARERRGSRGATSRRRPLPRLGRQPATPAEFQRIATVKTGQRPLTPRGFRSEQPAWSPDGTKIAFTRYDEPEDPKDILDTEIYVVNVADSRERQLTAARHADDDPSWSPDGKTIAARRVSEPAAKDTWFARKTEFAYPTRLRRKPVGRK